MGASPLDSDMSDTQHSRLQSPQRDTDACHRLRHDWGGDEELGPLIHLAVEESGLDVDADALYDVLDPDALDALFAPPSDGTPRDGGSVTFPLGDATVTVHATGEIVVATGGRGDE